MKTMARTLLTFLCSMLWICNFAQTTTNPLITLNDWTEARADVGGNIWTKFIVDWPQDANGDQDCALIIVKFENMNTANVGNVNFQLSPSAPLVKVINQLQEIGEMLVFVTPSSNAYFEVYMERFGASNRLSGLSLKPKKAYEVTLRGERTVSINVMSRPTGIPVSIESGESDTTDATFTDVSLGKHRLTFTLDGETVTKEIQVSDDNVKFEYDFRKKKQIKVISDPVDAELYVNGEMVGYTPCDINLPHDIHTLIAKKGANRDTLIITVNSTSPKLYKLDPVKKISLELIPMYQGRPVPADFYVDSELEGEGESSYRRSFPLGRSYEMTMRYRGNVKTRNIRISSKMATEQKFKIPARHEFVWPWQREYNTDPFGISFGYVSKQLVSRGGGHKIKENGIWGEEGLDKSLHGLQFGLFGEPCFKFGLGLHTGLYYEFYMSKSDNSSYDYNKFQEHCLNIPVHLMYRLRLARKVALKLHGGAGFNYVVYGEISDDSDSLEEITDFYGDGTYKRFNMTLDMAVALRLGAFQLEGQYCKGIYDHKLQEGYKTTQNKIQLSLSIMISTNR